MASPQAIAEGSDNVWSDQLKYNQKIFANPNYRYEPQFPNTYGQTIALTTSQSPVVINLPPDVFNLAQSYLEYLVTLPLSDTNYIWTFEDTLTEISHIQLYGSNNQWIADLDNLQNYIKIVTKRETSMNEFLTFDPLNAMSANNCLNNVVPALRHSVAGAIAPANASSLNYLEPAYFNVGVLGNAGTTTGGVSYQVQFPLRLIKDTIFAIDKNMYAGQLLYMKLYFGPISKICYQSKSNANPSTGTPATYSGAGTISNLQLMLAVDTNEGNRTRAIANASSPQGMSLVIPWVQSYKNSNQNSTQNISIQMDIGSGRSIMKIIHSVFNNAEALDVAYDCQNNSTIGAVGMTQKVQQYYTQINGKRLQDLTLTCTGASGDLFTDYMQQKRQLRGSVMENYNVYQYNWHHCDDFCEFGAHYEQNNNNELVAGMPLGAVPITWTFVGTQMVSASYQHYTWVCFTKKLILSPQGIQVV